MNFNNKPFEFSNNLLQLKIDDIKLHLKTDNIKTLEIEVFVKALHVWELGYIQTNFETLSLEQLPILMIKHNFSFTLKKEVRNHI